MTFAARNGIKSPSVLIVQKLPPNEAQQVDASVLKAIYNVFMSTPHTSGTGIDNKEKPVYRRQPDGQEMMDGSSARIRDDEIGVVPRTFRDWISRKSGI